MEWSSQFHPIFAAWVGTLTVEDQEALLASIRVLERLGPTLGRPLVDTVKGSRHKNMKELRPPSNGGSEIRVLFAFDPERRAILLVGGDKSGDWSRWYDVNVPVADERFDAHLANIAEEQKIGRDAERSRSIGTRGRGKR